MIPGNRSIRALKFNNFFLGGGLLFGEHNFCILYTILHKICQVYFHVFFYLLNLLNKKFSLRLIDLTLRMLQIYAHKYIDHIQSFTKNANIFPLMVGIAIIGFSTALCTL